MNIRTRYQGKIIENIVGKKGAKNGKIYYHVKWVGSDKKEWVDGDKLPVKLIQKFNNK